ncbi:DUF2680 domain-containing protein [Clostridiaceae bacterium 35-E11]
MKKILTIVTIVSLLTLAFGSFVFAADTEEAPQWFKDMISWKKGQINEAVKDGQITDEQAKVWNDHFDYMEKWHNENGFYNGGSGFGACHGSFGSGRGFRGGFGPGRTTGVGL